MWFYLYTIPERSQTLTYPHPTLTLPLPSPPGESYAGMYIPWIAQHIVKVQTNEGGEAFYPGAPGDLPPYCHYISTTTTPIFSLYEPPSFLSTNPLVPPLTTPYRHYISTPIIYRLFSLPTPFICSPPLTTPSSNPFFHLLFPVLRTYISTCYYHRSHSYQFERRGDW